MHDALLSVLCGIMTLSPRVVSARHPRRTFFACLLFDTFQVQSAGGLLRGFPGRNDYTVTDVRPDQLTLNLAEGSTWFEVCMACE